MMQQQPQQQPTSSSLGIANPSAGKGGAVQAAQAAMAQAESQRKAGSPRPMESMMNGPRSNATGHQQNNLHNHSIENTNAMKLETASATATGGGSLDTSSIKSSASATPQPASPESSQDSLTNQTAAGSAGDDENSNQSIKQDIKSVIISSSSLEIVELFD